ncbi:MAG: NUDIX hydrolase [Anaerolineae bacterium]
MVNHEQRAAPAWDSSLPVYHVQLNITRDTRNYWFLSRRKREAEVVLILQRLNGKYLVHTKSFYPPGAWRVMTGGIIPGEEPAAAALREADEETGLKVRLVRGLARIEYTFTFREETLKFNSYIYLLRELGGSLVSGDAGESISGFREVTLEDLPALARHLEELQGESWADWGRFRAAAHCIVYQLLKEPDGTD